MRNGNTIRNLARAFAQSVTDLTTWVLAGALAIPFATVFLLITIFGVACGASPASGTRYLVGCLSCSVAGALLTSVAYCTFWFYQREKVLSRRFARRRAVRRTR